MRENGTKCVLCQDEMLLIDLPEPCPYCGHDRCYVDRETGQNVCSESIGDWSLYYDPSGKNNDRVMDRYCEESFSEYADTLVVVRPGQPKASFPYRDGLLMDLGEVTGEQPSFGELDEELRDVVGAIVSGTEWVSTDAWRGYERPPSDGKLTKVHWARTLDGWHSSMESSELSEALNDLTRGEVALDYPLVIVFSKTSNVCSIGLSVYSRKMDLPQVQDLLKGKRAMPGSAGF